jgi:hypothetical protein
MSQKPKRRPKNRSRVQRMSSWEVEGAESNFQMWDDAEWEPALSALGGYGPDSEFLGKSDPKPLAKLLGSGKPVPEVVAKQLGWWLDPPWGKKGPRLVVHLPSRYYPAARGLSERIKIKQKIEGALEEEGKLESVVAQVQQETGYSRAYIMNAWRLTIQEVIALSSKFTPDPFLSLRNLNTREDSVFADMPGCARIRASYPQIEDSNNDSSKVRRSRPGAGPTSKARSGRKESLSHK